MKKIIITLVAVVLGIALNAQAPNSFNYQAVARGSDGKLLKNQNVSLRVSVLKGSSSGSLIYSETHTVSTNKYGLINISVGTGTVVSGTFGNIKWSSDKYFIKTDMDPNGGSAYKFISTQQLMSVPYALHAKTVANDRFIDADANPKNELQKITQVGNKITLSQGGGTVITTDKVKDADADPKNELQKLSILGTNLLLSKAGGTIPLSALNYWKKSTGLLYTTEKVAIASQLGHYGDGDTYLDFGTDEISLNAGGVKMLNLREGTGDYITSPVGVDWGIGKTYNDVKLTIESTESEKNKFGIYATNNVNTKIYSTGVHGQSSITGTYNYNSKGIEGYGSNKSTGTGVRYAYGGYFASYMNNAIGSSRSFGIYSKYIGTAADVEYAGYFAGNIYTTKVILPSDANLKKDVKNLNSSIYNIMSLPVKTYNYKTTELAHMNLPQGRQTGIMAQDLENIYPELVSKSAQPALSEKEQERMIKNGETISDAAKKEIKFKGVDYIGLVPHLVKAMQEQQKMIAEQNALILQLQKDLEELKK